MADSDGLVEPDMFDPELAQLAEKNKAEIAAEHLSDVEQFLRNRQRAYADVFGNADPGSLAFVMADLAWFCRAYGTTYDDIPGRMALQEGRREVYNRIMDHTLLDHNTLFVKYHSSNPRTAR